MVSTRGLRLTIVCLLASACPPWGAAKRTYSSDIGVEAVSVDTGSLEGTWLAQMELSSIIELPIVGSRSGGSNRGRLVHLRWDAAQAAYHVDMKWCWADIFEVEGVSHRFEDSALDHLDLVRSDATMDHEKGSLETGRTLDIWALRGMPDAFTTALPNHDNYDSPPQSDWVFDQDQDGKPAVTVHMSGTLNGDGYVVARTIFRLTGVTRTPDEVVGLFQAERIEQRMLDSTINVMGVNQSAVETSERPDDNPKNSWFQMVRGPDAATCDDVRSARDDGRLPSRRPF